MLIYTTLAIAVIAFFILSFLNGKAFGAEPDPKQFTYLQNYSGGKFHNLSPTPMFSADANYFKLLRTLSSKAKDNRPSQVIKVVKTNLKVKDMPNGTLVWFGHSSYLLYLDGKTVLVDPVFYNAAPGPFVGKPYPMSYRYLPEDMPEIDVLVLTHDHYDHMDYRALIKLKGKIKSIVTSKGVDAHLKSWNFDPLIIHSMAWKDSTTVYGFEFTALPARHFSGRKFKRGNTLWSSFVLKSDTFKIYLGGDSGYDTHFKDIGRDFGPFDLAILECGQYGRYWPLIHMVPEETLQASKDLEAKALLAVHWGKFSLSDHGWTEPIERLLAANADHQQKIYTPQIGELLKIDGEEQTAYWWI